MIKTYTLFGLVILKFSMELHLHAQVKLNLKIIKEQEVFNILNLVLGLEIRLFK